MIDLKTDEEIEIIARSGKILAEVTKKIVEEARVGTSLVDLDKLAESLIRRAGAESAFLNYKPNGAKHPYKASICTSLNDTIVHGFPTNYKLESGDVLKLDFGVRYAEFYSDIAVTVLIGKVSEIAKKLVKTTREALFAAINKARPGNTLGDIGFEIENCAKSNGFRVIRLLTGHGIGSKLHEKPDVYNFGERKKGIKLKPGMVLAIEPMLSAGTDEIIQNPDDSWATRDGSLSAHFEHTVAITSRGPRVLTEVKN